MLYIHITLSNELYLTKLQNVIVQGNLEWYGVSLQPTWTSIASTVNTGANTITVKDAVCRAD